MKPTILLALFCACRALALELPGTIAGPLTNPANGCLYYLLEHNTWTRSQTVATRLGGNLTSIKNAAEARWVTETFAKIIGREGRLWIGLNDLAENGNFNWIDGEPFAFSRWYPGEPNNIGTEHYVYMSEGKFDNARDISTDHEGRPVCAVVKVQPSDFVPAMTAVEAVSEPASTVMAAWKSLLVAGILLFLSGILLGGAGVFVFQKIRER